MPIESNSVLKIHCASVKYFKGDPSLNLGSNCHIEILKTGKSYDDLKSWRENLTNYKAKTIEKSYIEKPS